LYEASSLGFPLFVKPANLGSSIGISRATDKLSLRAAMDVAASYDRRIIVERGIDHPREVNCACLGFGASCMASVCEQPISTDELLSFDKKYLENPSGKGMKSLARTVPAPISDEMTKRIQQMTCDIFRMLECKGVVRIDYMIDDASQELYVNEINTIPGSLSNYLWDFSGVPFPALVDRLIDQAFARSREAGFKVTDFGGNIFKHLGQGAKTGKLGKK
jgi:D-alanine-D-alanine ligase